MKRRGRYFREEIERTEHERYQGQVKIFWDTLAACLADGSVQVWAVPNVKKKENIVTELKAENMCIFKGELVTKNPMRGGLSLSWSQG